MLVSAVCAFILILPTLVNFVEQQHTKQVELVPHLIQAIDGFAYLYPLGRITSKWSILSVSNDTSASPKASRVRLFQGFSELGPAHALHAEVATDGKGKFSHWDDQLVFSSSDGTDPRTNNYKYYVQYTYQLKAWLLPYLVVIGVSAATLGLDLIWRTKKARLTSAVVFRRKIPIEVIFTVAIFALVALGYFLLVVSKPWPLALSWTDPANVASFVAGWLHPERFGSDPILADRSNYSFYLTVLIPIVMVLNLLLRDIGASYAAMMFPLVFLQLLGFWRLGLLLYGKNFPAVVLSLTSLAPVYIFGASDLWGVLDEPLTRMAYGAVFPFILLLFLRYCSGRCAPLWLFAVCGLSIYAHPPSAPPVAFGLWCGCFAIRSFSRFDLAIMLLSGIVFVVLAMPLALIFAAHPMPNLDWHGLIAKHYTDAWFALRSLVDGWGASWIVWIVGLSGYLVTYYFRPAQRSLVLFFVFFVFGLITASFGVSWIDQQIAVAFNRAPVQLDLIRGLRFLIPVLLVGAVWLLLVASQQLSEAVPAFPWRQTGAASMVLLLLFWWSEHPSAMSEAAANIVEGSRSHRGQRDRDRATVLERLKRWKADTKVLVMGDDLLALSVRYAALQPVVMVSKDLNVIRYSGGAKEKENEWDEFSRLRELLKTVETLQEAKIVIAEMVTRGRVRLILLDRSEKGISTLALEQIGSEIIANENFRLIEVRAEGS